jgi:hypothetical protein
MRPLGAIGESASLSGVHGVFGWTSGPAEFDLSQKLAKRNPRQRFIAVPADRVLVPSCNRDRATDAGISADNVLQTPPMLRSTLHPPVLARSNSLKALSLFLLSSRACWIADYLKSIWIEVLRAWLISRRATIKPLLRVVTKVLGSSASSTLRARSHAKSICVNYDAHVRKRTYRPCQNRHDAISNGQMRASALSFTAGKCVQPGDKSSE